MVCNAKANWNRVTADPACTDCVYRFVPKRTKWRSWWPGGTNHRSKHGVCSGRCAHRFFHGDIWRRFIAQRKRRCRRVLIRFGNRPRRRPRSQVGSTCFSDIPLASSEPSVFFALLPIIQDGMGLIVFSSTRTNDSKNYSRENPRGRTTFLPIVARCGWSASVH